MKVHTRSGIVINVEIQIASSTELAKRIVLYTAKILTGQIKRGDRYGRMERVISIVIINDILIPEEEGYYNEYTILNKKTGREFTDLLGIKVLELPKLPETFDGGRLWNWG